MLGLRGKQLGVLLVLLTSCLTFFILGIAFNDLVDLFIKVMIKKNLPLRNGTLAFKFWQKPPVPVNFGIYVFHVANPAEVLDGKEVPAVVEKGPYVYKMHIEKTDIRWHDNNTIEYVQPQRFIFDRESSVGPETDTFITVNIPYIAAATVLQHEPKWMQELVDDYFISQNETAFMNRSVHDIWWGYNDPVLEEVANILHWLNKNSSLFNGMFGFFMNRNNTGDGLYNVFSGTNEQFDNYVHIDRWNSVKNLSIWRSDYANEIRGTDGSMQAPLVNSESKLSIFDAYLYRSLNLQYSGHSSYEGLSTLRFNVPYSEFANSTENPDNAGFCTPNCIPSGAYNMSVVCYYAPIYVSLPHFLGGDSYYQSQVTGLKPSQSRHQPFYEIQAIAGVSIRIARRYQIIVRTQSFKHFKTFHPFPVSYLPILWIDGVGAIDTDTATMFKKTIQDPMDTVPYIHGAMFGIAGLFIIIFVCLFAYWRKKNSKLLIKYSKDELNEDSRINSNERTSYGTHNHSSLKNHLIIQAVDPADIIENSDPNSHPSTSTSNSLPQAASESSGTNLNQDNSHEKSHYFDTVTSLSPERSEKYHSVDT